MKKLLYLLLTLTTTPALQLEAMAPAEDVTAATMSQLTAQLKPFGLGLGNGIDEDGAAEYFIYDSNDDACTSITTFTSMDHVTACIQKIEEYFTKASKPMQITGTVDTTKKTCAVSRDDGPVYFKFNSKKATLYGKDKKAFALVPMQGEEQWWLQIEEPTVQAAPTPAAPSEAETWFETSKNKLAAWGFTLVSIKTETTSTYEIHSDVGQTTCHTCATTADVDKFIDLEPTYQAAIKAGYTVDRTTQTCFIDQNGYHSFSTLNLQTQNWNPIKTTAIPAKKRFAMYNIKPDRENTRLLLLKQRALSAYLGPWHVVHGKLVLITPKAQ